MDTSLGILFRGVKPSLSAMAAFRVRQGQRDPSASARSACRYMPALIDATLLNKPRNMAMMGNNREGNRFRRVQRVNVMTVGMVEWVWQGLHFAIPIGRG